MKPVYFLIFTYFIATICASSQINSPLPQSKEEREVIIKLKVKSCTIDEYDVINEEKKRTENFDSTYYDVLGNIIFEVWGYPQEKDTFTTVTEYIYDGDNKLISQKIASYMGKNMRGPADCSIYEYDSKGNLIRECTPVMEKEQLTKEYCTEYIYSNEKIIQKNTTEGTYLYQYKGDSVLVTSEGENIPTDRYYKNTLISHKSEDGKEFFYYYDKMGFLIQSQGKRNGIPESVTTLEYENGMLKRIIYKDGNLRTNSIEEYRYTFY